MHLLSLPRLSQAEKPRIASRRVIALECFGHIKTPWAARFLMRGRLGVGVGVDGGIARAFHETPATMRGQSVLLATQIT